MFWLCNQSATIAFNYSDKQLDVTNLNLGLLDITIFQYTPHNGTHWR